jgi:hypothetical protein
MLMGLGGARENGAQVHVTSIRQDARAGVQRLPVEQDAVALASLNDLDVGRLLGGGEGAEC